MQLLSDFEPADKKQGRCLVAPASGLPVPLVYIELSLTRSGKYWKWSVVVPGATIASSLRATAFEAAAAAFGKAREYVRADRFPVLVLP